MNKTITAAIISVANNKDDNNYNYNKTTIRGAKVGKLLRRLKRHSLQTHTQ